MKRFLLFSLGILLSVLSLQVAAQSTYQIGSDSTAVPFLRIAPDARSGAMGDGSVACADDVNAVHWNLANLAFAKKRMSFALSYTPWMRALVPDINHAYLGFYVKPDSVSAIGGSVRYFSLGTITLLDPGMGDVAGQFRPYEYAADVGYTRKLTTHFSVGITARFIKSHLMGPRNFTFDIIKGMACAGDISASWKGKRIGDEAKNMIPSVGFALTNIGTKMWYRDRDSAEYIPSNARLGGALLLTLAPYHQFTLHGEANRLLVPTTTKALSTKEKLEQTTLSAGVEYVYLAMFKFRGGYFHQFESHGNNRYLTTGLGIAYNVFALDFSYLIAVNGERNPLDNTLRFTMLFSFDRIKARSNPSS